MKLKYTSIMLLIFFILSVMIFYGCTGGEEILITYYASDEPNDDYYINITYGMKDIPLVWAERFGMKFLGLYTSKNGGVQVYDANGHYKMEIEEPIELWAQWDYYEYDIVFDASDGNILGSSTIRKEYQSILSTFPTAEKEGFEFLGWEDEKGKLISNKEVVDQKFGKFNNENYIFNNENKVILKARYTTKKCIITLDRNDGSYSSTTQEIFYGETLNIETLPKEDTGNSELIGWSTNKHTYIPYDGVVTDDITLYAIWNDYKYVTCYEVDGEEPKIVKLYKNGEDTTYIPERPGYYFDGWYTSSAFAGNPVDYISYGGEADTYYAKWVLADYTITFANTDLSSISYKMGDLVRFELLEKEGYIFKGWCLNEDLSDVPMFQLSTDIYGDITLYPLFEPQIFMINLDLNGGTYYTDTIQASYQSNYIIDKPVREGYTFLGWYNEEDVQFTDKDGNSINPYDYLNDITLIAKWKVISYIISFESNGGTKFNPIYCDYGTTISFPEEPKHGGMFFEGWYNEDFTTKYDENYIVTGDTILYAKWIESIGISTYEDLLKISEDPTKNYHLLNDINFKGDKWTSIDNFSGILNGFGYKIYNISIGNYTNTPNYYAFIINNNGVIKNLTLSECSTNITLNNHNNMCHGSILVGCNNNVISNCHVEDASIMITFSCVERKTMTSEYYFGMICGFNRNTIEDCQVNGNINVDFVTNIYDGFGESITNQLHLGGLCGVNDATISNCTSTVNCEEYTTVISKEKVAQNNSILGGLIGYNRGVIFNSTSDFKLSVISKGHTTSGSPGSFANMYVSAGGFVGSNAGKIYQSKSNIDALINDFYGNCGGFVGNNFVDGDIKNCYSKAIINGLANTHKYCGNLYCGGFAGYNSGNLNSSYCEADITTTARMVGGLFCGGNSSSGKINNSFTYGIIKVTNDISYTSMFCAINEGIINKVIVQNDSLIYINNNDQTELIKNNNEIKNKVELITHDILINYLYWEEDIWIVDDLNYPKLYWESDLETNE